jgi:hypothetical protein
VQECGKDWRYEKPTVNSHESRAKKETAERNFTTENTEFTEVRVAESAEGGRQ